MWVKVIKRPISSIGPVGTVGKIDNVSAKALIALGRVEATDEPVKKRKYTRKDVVPEAVDVVDEKEVMEPERKAEDPSEAPLEFSTEVREE